MSTEPAVTMQDLELEHAELLPEPRNPLEKRRRLQRLQHLHLGPD